MEKVEEAVVEASGVLAWLEWGLARYHSAWGGRRILLVLVSTVGLLWVLRAFWQGIAVPVWRWATSSTTYELKSYGEWVVLTGCTDGIGKAMTLELARQYSVPMVLVGRNLDKLKALELEVGKATQPAPKVKLVQCDFDSFSDEPYERLNEALFGLDVGALVHCVGLSYPHPMPYDSVPPEFLDSLLAVNLRSALLCSRLVLPRMRANKRGCVVFVSSMLATVGVSPLLAAYASVKAALEVLAKSLQAELQGCNVHIQCHSPGLVKTKMTKVSKTSFSVLSPDAYAAAAVSQLATPSLSVAATVSSPAWQHRLMAFMLHVLPLDMAATQIYNPMWALYQSALRKAAATKKDS